MHPLKQTPQHGMLELLISISVHTLAWALALHTDRQNSGKVQVQVHKAPYHQLNPKHLPWLLGYLVSFSINRNANTQHTEFWGKLKYTSKIQAKSLSLQQMQRKTWQNLTPILDLKKEKPIIKLVIKRNVFTLSSVRNICQKMQGSLILNGDVRRLLVKDTHFQYLQTAL